MAGGGEAPTSGSTDTGGSTAGSAGEPPGSGGVTNDAGGSAGAEEPGGPAAECTRNSDCVAINECYSASCEDGSCVDSPLERGSACESGFCNGFAGCLPCLDDAPGLEQDTGCPAGSPLCTETASEPVCVGCERDSDCSDGIECTVDHCRESVCENVPSPLGSSCADGVCTGEADVDSCVPCVDDAEAGLDTGCTMDQPVCDTSKTPAACSCQLTSDCDDNNDCTADSCNEGRCEHATLINGTPCPEGYCNGIQGEEVCITRRCLADEDCDDGAACTLDVCESNLCTYATDDEQCPDSGDVCKPNVCTVGTGCQQIDTSQSLELLSNGNLESGYEGWTEMSENYDHVIFVYGYIPTLQPHTTPYVAWLGGGEGLLDESNSLSQVVSVPAGAAELKLSFFYQIWTEEGLPDDHNHLQVSVRSTEADGTDDEIVTFYNQDETRVWTHFSATIDAIPFAGSYAILEFSGTGIDGFTHFFIDTISLVATVCE